MEKSKAIKIVSAWSIHDGTNRDEVTSDTQCEFYAALDFVLWLYEHGYTIESRYIDKDAEEQEKHDSKK